MISVGTPSDVRIFSNRSSPLLCGAAAAREPSSALPPAPLTADAVASFFGAGLSAEQHSCATCAGSSPQTLAPVTW